MTRTLLLSLSLLVACGPSAGTTGTGTTSTDAGSEADPGADTTTTEPGYGHEDSGGHADVDSGSDGSGDGDGDGDSGSDSDSGSDGGSCGECEDTDCFVASCEQGICTRRTVKPCDELDGTGDIWLFMSIVAHDPRLDAYTPGSLLRVYGEQYECDEDECGFVEWAVVREGSGDLLSARFIYKPSPDPVVLDLFGLTVDNWLAPLTLIAVDQDYCEPFDGGCGDDSWQQRATYDLLHPGDDPARLIDSSVGWAPGGFSVSTPYWQDGYVTCIYLPPPAIVRMFRDACEGDCPPPTFVNSCEPPVPSSSYDYLSINILPHSEGSTDGPFDAQCTVLDTELTPKPAGELDILVELDCVFPVEPGSM